MIVVTLLAGFLIVLVIIAYYWAKAIDSMPDDSDPRWKEIKDIWP